jgi:hypothetical protein
MQDPGWPVILTPSRGSGVQHRWLCGSVAALRRSAPLAVVTSRVRLRGEIPGEVRRGRVRCLPGHWITVSTAIGGNGHGTIDDRRVISRAARCCQPHPARKSVVIFAVPRQPEHRARTQPRSAGRRLSPWLMTRVGVADVSKFAIRAFLCANQHNHPSSIACQSKSGDVFGGARLKAGGHRVGVRAGRGRGWGSSREASAWSAPGVALSGVNGPVTGWRECVVVAAG